MIHGFKLSTPRTIFVFFGLQFFNFFQALEKISRYNFEQKKAPVSSITDCQSEILIVIYNLMAIFLFNFDALFDKGIPVRNSLDHLFEKRQRILLNFLNNINFIFHVKIVVLLHFWHVVIYER